MWLCGCVVVMWWRGCVVVWCLRGLVVWCGVVVGWCSEELSMSFLTLVYISIFAVWLIQEVAAAQVLQRRSDACATVFKARIRGVSSVWYSRQ